MTQTEKDKDHQEQSEDGNMAAQGEDLAAQVENYKDLYLRSQAELKNLVRRHGLEVVSAQKYALENFLSSMLPTLDSIDLAVQQTKDSSMGTGISMTRDMMFATFKRFGIEPIEIEEGEMFNPEAHEAIKVESCPDATEGQILYEMQRGYRLNGRVIRPVRVCVVDFKQNEGEE